MSTGEPTNRTTGVWYIGTCVKVIKANVTVKKTSIDISTGEDKNTYSFLNGEYEACFKIQPQLTQTNTESAETLTNANNRRHLT